MQVINNNYYSVVITKIKLKNNNYYSGLLCSLWIVNWIFN